MSTLPSTTAAAAAAAIHPVLCCFPPACPCPIVGMSVWNKMMVITSEKKKPTDHYCMSFHPSNLESGMSYLVPRCSKDESKVGCICTPPCVLIVLSFLSALTVWSIQYYTFCTNSYETSVSTNPNKEIKRKFGDYTTSEYHFHRSHR